MGRQRFWTHLPWHLLNALRVALLVAEDLALCWLKSAPLAIGDFPEAMKLFTAVDDSLATDGVPRVTNG